MDSDSHRPVTNRGYMAGTALQQQGFAHIGTA